MNSKELTYILQHPETLNKEQTESLKNVLDEFPYFQSARAIYLKGLKNQDSYKYNQELKTTAAYTTDRSILFDFITSDSFLQNEISLNIKQNLQNLKDIEVEVEDISVEKSIQVDNDLRSQIRETVNVLDPELFQRKFENKESSEEESNQIKKQTSTKKESIKEILNIGKPLEFDKNETHSFHEWLKLTQFKPIDRSSESSEKQEVSKEEETRLKKFELIDKFISNKPKISPDKETSSSTNLAKERMIQPESLMTETLARIYVEQKNYEKAIQSYKILSLKYPEKSGFFADQIKAIKKIQEE